MTVKLIDTAFWLPSHTVSSEEVAARTDSDAEFIKTKVGIRSRRFLRSDETGLDMGVEAVKALVDRRPDLSLDEVGLVIFVTQTPDVALPHMAGQIQDRLGIPSGASFDVGLGCSGFVYALSIAKGLMLSEEIAHALIVTSDPYSKIMKGDDRDTLTVFGDGAAATWLSTDEALKGATLGRTDFGTDGSGAEHLTIVGDRTDQATPTIWTPLDAPEIDSRPRLYMHGRSVFNFMMKRVPGSIDAALEMNGIGKDDIDYFVFHQASEYMLKSLSRRARIDADKVPILMGEIGNTVSSTIPIALTQIADGEFGDGPPADKTPLQGKAVLLSGFGVGLSWASTVLTYD